jgi:selenocysteine lyase/cysteine desulfurase
MGFLWGKLDALRRLPTFREEFIPDAPPHKIEAGTFIYENVAGMAAAIDYFEALGEQIDAGASTARARVLAALSGIEAYEQDLSRAMLAVLESAGAMVYGVSDPAQAALRVPTFTFNLPGVDPANVAGRMAEAEVGIRDGHMYAPRLMDRLGLAMNKGAVRASLVHYNTPAEIERFGEVLRRVSRTARADA